MKQSVVYGGQIHTKWQLLTGSREPENSRSGAVFRFTEGRFS